MKGAISATNGYIYAQLEKRFGRASYFVTVDTNPMRFGLDTNRTVRATHGAPP